MRAHGGLRLRSALSFSLLAFLLSATLSVATYQLARSYLLQQRVTLGTRVDRRTPGPGSPEPFRRC